MNGGNYQGSREQEQQAQDDWEVAGRPGDNDNNDDDNDNNERTCENPPNAASSNNGEDANGLPSYQHV